MSGGKMKNSEIKLTGVDRLILKSYSSMLDGLSKYLGTGYEMVLHSLEDFSHSAINVINGYHTPPGGGTHYRFGIKDVRGTSE